MYIVIVGAGRIGFHLAQKLIADHHVVTMIEKDRARSESALEGLGEAIVITGDGCDPKCLESAETHRADVIAAVTSDDEDNLVICQLAKEVFKVRRAVARVNNPRNEHVFAELGVDVPINSTAIIAKIIEEEVSFEDFINLMTFKRGKLALVRVDLPETSPVVGKLVKDVQLPENSVLVSIVRGETIVVPKGDTLLVQGDDIIALTTIENEKTLLNSLIGKID